MSIDALIQKHIEALNTNTEAVKLLTLSLAGRTPVKTDVPLKAEKAAAKVVVEKDDVPDFEVKELKELQSEKEAPILVNHTAVPYETVRALVLMLAPTQRDAIKALNAKHGIANLKVLLDKEDDFSTVNDQVKLEAVYADLQALEA
jgi:hypothetical protein